MRIDPSSRREFVYAQARVHRPFLASDERLMDIALAMPFIHRVMAESGRIETAKKMHYGASIGLPSGPSGTGTRLDTAGSDFKYANIALRSSSGSCP